MELQKRRQEETNERKNAVEAYVYSLRGKLSDSLAPYATEAEAARVNDRLNATEVRRELRGNRAWWRPKNPMEAYAEGGTVSGKQVQ